MKNYNPEQSGKKTFTEVITAHTATAVLLFVLSIFLLLQAHDLRADSGSGMINRAPLVKAAPKPTALEKISSNLDEIIKSINEIPEEVEEDNVTAEQEKPAEKIKVLEPAIAEPKKTAHVPVKVETVKIESEEIPAKPVVATQKQTPLLPAVKTSTQEAYFKLAANGEKLQNSTPTWDCVEDTNSGLTWEVKSSNGDIRDKNHLYTWFDPSHNSGIADGGRCKGDISCDTNAYVQALNKQKLCGHDDWRLPTREEMQSLVYLDDNKADTKINTEYFPEALASWYWTASSNINNPDYAWYVLFRNGVSLNDLKDRPKHVRLVRTDNKV